jgi:glycosyltransferase involved in cell wall biosynthesis
MRIAFFTDSFLPSVSGIAAAITNLTYGLSTAGHDIVIFAPKKDGFTQNVFDKRRVRIEYVPSWPVFFNPNLRASSPLSMRIYKNLKSFDPHVIHFHTPFLLGAASIIFSSLEKKPLVATFHSYFMTPEYLKSVGLEGNNQLLSQGLWHYAQGFYNKCQAVVTPTAVVKSDLAAHSKNTHIEVIPSPINEHVIKKAQAPKVAVLKKKYKLSDKVILSVSRLSAEKSIDELLKAFALVLTQIPQTSLFIVGGGPEGPALRALAKELKIEERVIFAGEVAQAQVLSQGYFQAASVFASPSTSETQGLSLVEAMYFGVPLVGVNARGVGEVARDVGLLSPPHRIDLLASNLVKILSNSKLEQRLAEKSRQEFARTYKIEKIVARYETLYNRIITKSSV